MAKPQWRSTIRTADQDRHQLVVASNQLGIGVNVNVNVNNIHSNPIGSALIGRPQGKQRLQHIVAKMTIRTAIQNKVGLRHRHSLCNRTKQRAADLDDLQPRTTEFTCLS
jgi:hypothetical protein